MKPVDAEVIEKQVAQLTKEGVVLYLLKALEDKERAVTAIRMATSRIVAEEILSSGELFTLPDGTELMWGGDRHRECTDPVALKLALRGIALNPPALRAFNAAFKPQPDKVSMQQLDLIARFCPEAEPIIRDFTKWKEGEPHLRPRSHER